MGWVVGISVAIALVLIAYLGYNPFPQPIVSFPKPVAPHVQEVKQESRAQTNRQTNLTRTQATNTRVTRRTYSPTGVIIGETIIESTSDTKVVRSDNISSSSVTLTQNRVVTGGDSGLGAGVIINGNGIGLGVSKDVLKLPLDTAVSVGAGVVINPITKQPAPSLTIGLQAKPLPNLSATIGPSITTNTPLGYNIGPVGITPQVSVEYKF